MNFILHLLKTDLRRFAWPIAAWVALTAAATVLQTTAPQLVSDLEFWPFFAMSAALLWIARMLFAAALVVIIVQTHTAVGTTAFWLTRPIPRGALVTAKLLLALGSIVGVAGLADIALMIVFEVPVIDMIKVVLEWSIVRSLGVLAVMVVGVLTRNLAQFALASGGTSAAV